MTDEMVNVPAQQWAALNGQLQHAYARLGEQIMYAEHLQKENAQMKEHWLSVEDKEGVRRVDCSCGHYSGNAIIANQESLDRMELDSFRHRFPHGVTFLDEQETPNQGASNRESRRSATRATAAGTKPGRAKRTKRS